MLISRDEINKSLKSHGWDYRKNAIHKSYNFDTYMDGIAFINKIADSAERMNHHPDIKVGWCAIDISVMSHDLGGVSTKCINLATEIDGLYSS